MRVVRWHCDFIKRLYKRYSVVLTASALLSQHGVTSPNLGVLVLYKFTQLIVMHLNAAILAFHFSVERRFLDSDVCQTTLVSFTIELIRRSEACSQMCILVSTDCSR